MRTQRTDVLLPLVTTAAVVGLWEALSRSGAFPPELPPFSNVLAWLAGNVTSGELWTAIGLTLLHWITALVIGLAIGAVVGGLMAAIPPVGELLIGVVEFFRPIPVVVYLPVMLLLLGARSQVVVILAAVAAIWPMLLHTLYGMRSVDPVAQDTARVFGLTRRQRLLSVTVPGILPYVGTGVRIAAAITLLAGISVELVGAVPGLGNLLSTYAANGIYDAVYGVIVVIGLIGIALNAVFERLEAHVLHWHPSHRVRTA